AEYDARMRLYFDGRQRIELHARECSHLLVQELDVAHSLRSYGFVCPVDLISVDAKPFGPPSVQPHRIVPNGGATTLANRVDDLPHGLLDRLSVRGRLCLRFL